MLWAPSISVNLDPVSIYPCRVQMFPSPLVQLFPEGPRSLWGGWGITSIHPCCVFAGSFFLGTQPLQSMFSRPKNWLRSKNWARVCDFSWGSCPQPPCNSFSFCLTYVDILLFGVYTLRIINVFLKNWLFYHDVVLLFIPDNFLYFEVCFVWD